MVEVSYYSYAELLVDVAVINSPKIVELSYKIWEFLLFWF